MSQLTDNYFPFDTGPGSGATPDRWRLMARNFYQSGIIPGYKNQMIPKLTGTNVTVDLGACWVDGFYGEIQTLKSFTVTGAGMVVARADPTNRQVLVVFVAGQTVPTQSLTGIYEIPIMQITGTTPSLVGTDTRQLASSVSIPSGVMWDYGGSVAPVGWLLCDGSSYPTIHYPNLFAAISYTWGGTGANFNVPDSRGRAHVGSGAGTGLTSRALAAKGGEENHILVVGEVASHAHTGSVSGTSGGVSANHTHGSTQGSGFAGTGLGTFGPTAGGGPPTVSGPVPATTANSVNHTHAFSDSFTTSNNGSGTAHNNMQPYIVVMKIIKV